MEAASLQPLPNENVPKSLLMVKCVEKTKNNKIL